MASIDLTEAIATVERWSHPRGHLRAHGSLHGSYFRAKEIGNLTSLYENGKV